MYRDNTVDHSQVLEQISFNNFQIDPEIAVVDGKLDVFLLEEDSALDSIVKEFNAISLPGESPVTAQPELLDSDLV